MPLVSGVCRVASAPMLSHGGSRLNASKPEANPKTSCPFQISKTEREQKNSRRTWFFRMNVFSYSKEKGSHTKFTCRFFWFSQKFQKRVALCSQRVRSTENGKKLTSHSKNRIASQTIAASRCLDGAKYMKNSRDFSFFHLLPLRKPRTNAEHHAQKRFRNDCWLPKRNLVELTFFWENARVRSWPCFENVSCFGRFFSVKGKELHVFFHHTQTHYVPLQTIGHAWAGIRGMPRLRRGWRSIHAPRR
jgi:hypothetical protein